MSVKKNFSNKLQTGWMLVSLIVIIALALSGCGAAQQAKTYKVGILSGMELFSPAIDGFKNKMKELGYIEGQNITYDVQSTNVDVAVYKSIVKKFVDEKVDLILSYPTEASMEAKNGIQGTNISLVFTNSFTDVKGMDLIKSVREPGGNVTGVRFPSVDIASKRMEILLKLVPTAKRIFVPFLKDYPNVPSQLEAVRLLAASKGVELIEFGAASPQDLQAKLDGLNTSGGGIDAILLLAEPLGGTDVFYAVLGKFAYDHMIPIGGVTMSVGKDYASIFGLTPDPKTTGLQAALLADKIFRGTPAGTIPVITSESFFQINYKAAQALGVTVPDGLIKQADEVIR
jgi:putative ABC transport system substrate-binding protein